MKNKLIKKMILIVIVLVAVLLSGLLIYTYRWNLVHPLKKETIMIDGLERKFVYHVPAKLKPHPKLIIAYHGTAMPANLMQIFTGHEFDLLADEEQNAIIVYPQGYKNNWNDCRINAPFPAKQLNLDDVGFTGKIINFFKDRYDISAEEVYAIGFSNGGQMVFKLARQQPGWFKGFAVISANLPEESNDGCRDSGQPVSMIIFSGMKDPIVPFDGGRVELDGKELGSVLSTEQTLQYWLDAGHFALLPETGPANRNDKKGSAATAVRQDYYSVSPQKHISIIKMLDGGHTIPNRNFRIPIKKMGNMNKDIDAPMIIWNFFKLLN